MIGVQLLPPLAMTYTCPAGRELNVSTTSAGRDAGKTASATTAYTSAGGTFFSAQRRARSASAASTVIGPARSDESMTRYCVPPTVTWR